MFLVELLVERLFEHDEVEYVGNVVVFGLERSVSHISIISHQRQFRTTQL
jgi:hypothetical protein